MPTTTNLSTLKINYLTQAQYDTALANGQISDDELYFTPNEPNVTINLNGTDVTSPSFYAPLTAGTSGQYLKSNGSGAPTWGQVDFATTANQAAHADNADMATYATSAGSATDNTKLPLAGGTMTGALILHDAPSIDLQAATKKYVDDSMSSVAGPMRFMGTLGTSTASPTVTSIPSADPTNKGYSYKVITDGTYQTKSAKSGDLIVSTGSEWVVIPSGDEPSGTVINVATGSGLTGGPISVTGTISHAVPTGASSATLGSTTSRYYIKTITTDDFGHVTGVTTGNETVTNTDEKVKQLADTTSNTAFPIILGYSTATTTVTNNVNKNNNFTYNPSTKELKVTSGKVTASTFSGGLAGTASNASYAGTANYANLATTAGFATTSAYANSVSWVNISDKPSSFTPAVHTHYSLTTIGDQRATTNTPATYSDALIFQGLKAKATIGEPSTDKYSYVVGLRGWDDASGGDAHELAFNNTGIYWRHGATSTWGDWNRLVTNSGSWTITAATAGYSTTASYTGTANYANLATTAGYAIDNTKLPLAGGTMTGAVKIKGIMGTSGTDYGATLPASGTEGQLFFQTSGEYYELPAGGTAGYALVKSSSADRDVMWAPMAAAGPALNTTVNAIAKYSDTSGTLANSTVTITTVGTIETPANVWAGNASQTGERTIKVESGAGKLELYAKGSTSGNRGIYTYNNAGTGTNVITIDQDNVITLNGRATQDGSGNTITSTYVKKAGDTITGTLILSKTTDAEMGADNGPALIVGGTRTTPHIEIDNNEIIAKADGTTGTDLWLNGISKVTNTGKVYGAVWNDYAEYRKDNPKEKQEPGRCVHELGDGSLGLTTKRLQRGCEIISDTFGFAIGQDKENGYNTPIASNGRVLAYPYESIEEFSKHIGWPVCSGPNGTVSIMTQTEEEKYPSRIVGTISEIPTYEQWGEDKVKVNNRVWIRVR